MNREEKRLLQRQRQIGEDGQPLASPRAQQRAVPRPGQKTRFNPWNWLKEVKAELRKVAWPTREEVRRYSTVVLATLLALIAIIFGLDFIFEKAAEFLFR